MKRFSILDIEDAKQFVGTFVKFGYCLDDLDNSEYGLLIDVSEEKSIYSPYRVFTSDCIIDKYSCIQTVDFDSKVTSCFSILKELSYKEKKAVLAFIEWLLVKGVKDVQK